MSEKAHKKMGMAANASLLIFAISSVALPICLVKISEELDLSLTQGGALGFIISVEMFIILLLSGFIAARFGKIRVLRAGLILLATGLLLFSQASSYYPAICAILVVGLGSAILEALPTPLIEDLYPEDNGSKQNLLHAFWPIGVLIGTLVIGELLSRQVSWRWVFAGIAIVVLAVSLFYPSSKDVVLPTARSNFGQLRAILKQPKFFLMGFALFFAGGSEGAITYWLASYIQLNLGELPRAARIGTAVFALGMIIGRFATSWLADFFRLKSIIEVSTFLALLSGISFFFASQLLAVYLSVFFSGLTIACFWPSIQTYSVRVIPLDSTLIMTLLSCFGVIGFSSATLFMGIIGDTLGLKISFAVVPLYHAALLLLLFLESKVRLREI